MNRVSHAHLGKHKPGVKTASVQGCIAGNMRTHNAFPRPDAPLFFLRPPPRLLSRPGICVLIFVHDECAHVACVKCLKHNMRTAWLTFALFGFRFPVVSVCSAFVLRRPTTTFIHKNYHNSVFRNTRNTRKSTPGCD